MLNPCGKKFEWHDSADDFNKLNFDYEFTFIEKYFGMVKNLWA